MANNDLISRAAAIDEIEEYLEEYSELDQETGYHNLKWCAMEEAKDALLALPVVDAAPVVHGQWIDHKDEHQCSACKEFTVVDAYAWMQLQYDFCPYCGAKMDGGDENERNTAARSIHVKGQSSDQRNHERTKEQNHEYR